MWKGWTLSRSELLACGGTPCWAIARNGRKVSEPDSSDWAYEQLCIWNEMLRYADCNPHPWHEDKTWDRNVVVCEREYCVPSLFEPDVRGFWTLAISSSRDHVLTGLTEEQGHKLSPLMAISLMEFYGQERPLAPVAEGREKLQRVYPSMNKQAGRKFNETWLRDVTSHVAR